MSLIENIVSKVKPHNPQGEVRVVDRSPLNWLYITYNTVEELIRTDEQGRITPAAMKTFQWIDDLTLEIAIRDDEVFQDGEKLTSKSVKQSFDEMMRWRSPHPPGTQFNHPAGTKMEIVDEFKVRMKFPEPDGLAVGKFRAMHRMNSNFWKTTGFGYKRNGSGEGHW